MFKLIPRVASFVYYPINGSHLILKTGFVIHMLLNMMPKINIPTMFSGIK